MSQPITILHLEDEPVDAELIREAVASEGFHCEIHVVRDGGGYERFLGTGTPDMVLSDFRVPGFSGQEALQRLRARDAHIPFIFVSGSMGEERAVEILREGATDYVLKDHLNRLVPAMRRALREAHIRREAEAAARALRDSEQRLELALRGADLGLWDWNIASGEVVYNRRWATMLGHEPGEIEPHIDAWKSRIHPNDTSTVLAVLNDHLDGESDSFEAEYRMHAKHGGWRWVLNRGRVVQRDVQGRPLRATGTHLDITERKQAEQTNQQLEEQLQQAQKMESLGTLAGGIAHDFNNILGAIIGFSELVLNDLPSDSSSRKDMGEVLKAANRARALVEQILTFSRQHPQSLKPLHLPDVIREALQFLRATIPSTVEVQLRIEPGTPLIQGDANQLHQVIVNLVTNSLHALPDHQGLIEIGAGAIEITEELAPGLSGLHPGLHAQLHVRDSGHGMPPDVQARIFEPFFTTKRPGSGTGLGLAVVHGIIRKHLGVIRVNSAPGEGTRFDVLFPASPAPAGPAPRTLEDEPQVRGMRVMLVDDEPALVRMGQLMLERLGFSVEVFADGRAAEAAFEAEPDRFHMVISDQTMPRVTGLELADRILRLRPQTPFILTTGNHADVENARLLESGLAELLVKPFSFESLKAAVAAALRRS